MESWLYGIEPVAACLRARRRELHRLLLKDGKLSPRLSEIHALARGAGVDIQRSDTHGLGNACKSRQHQGVALACGALPTVELDDFLEARDEGPTLIVALDQVEDPQNLGGIARSAAFLGGHALGVLRSHSAPLSPTASKASAGALESFPVIEWPNLASALQRLQREGFIVLGSALEDAVDYRTVEPADRAVLVLGGEGSGLRSLTRRRCDVLVTIPGTPAMESLNVNVAAGILLSHFGTGGVRS